MSPTVKNILAVIAGVIVGSLVNMAIITLSASIIPPPNGANVTTLEGLRASMHLFEPKHFIMPFVAHAMGTFVGAFIAAKSSVNRKMRHALAVSVFFIIGGITNIIMLPAPMWFNVLDFLGAYFPMGYLAAVLNSKTTTVKQS